MPASPEQKDHALQKAGRIFAIIRSCAAEGLECPSNATLAKSVGYSSTASAADAISFLAAAGMIAVERANHTRVVTITATGQKTFGTARKAHHSARINEVSA